MSEEIGSKAFDGIPRLCKDPDTGLYGVVVDCVEVISGLDPIGLREKIYQEAKAKGPIAEGPAT